MANYEAIGKKWIHPTTGEVRYYVNDAWKYGGLELDFYNTGNIRDATLDGEDISNSEGRRLMNAVTKCWITEDGIVHVKYYGELSDFIKAVLDGVKKEVVKLQDAPKPKHKYGRFQIVPCDENGKVDISQDTEGFDTIKEFKEGIREWASNGWTFCGLHPWHMGHNLDMIYVKKVA